MEATRFTHNEPLPLLQERLALYENVFQLKWLFYRSKVWPKWRRILSTMLFGLCWRYSCQDGLFIVVWFRAWFKFCFVVINLVRLNCCPVQKRQQKTKLEPRNKSDKPQQTVYMHVFCADTGACMWLDKFKSWNFLLRLVTATLLVASWAGQLSGVKKNMLSAGFDKSLVC